MTPYIDQLVLLGFLGGMLWAMLKFMLRDIHRDLAELKEGQHKLETRMDRFEGRIDHLYEENNRLYKIMLEYLQKK